MAIVFHGSIKALEFSCQISNAFKEKKSEKNRELNFQHFFYNSHRLRAQHHRTEYAGFGLDALGRYS